ncbi:MAG: hypothetical protein U0R19_33595, partial [Bryobacteraceae bacterium]
DPARFFTVDRGNFVLNDDFLAFLEHEITTRRIGLVVLDSYTKLRSVRGSGADIVKAEANDFTNLDRLAKKLHCVILVIHHDSKGSAALSWDQKGAGTYGIAASVDGLISIERFAELDARAPERLIRVRGRHLPGTEFVARLNDRLSYDFVINGGAAPLYPLLRQIEKAFGRDQVFSPKSLCMSLGFSRATAHRVIGRLVASDAVTKVGFGEYLLSVRL